MRAHFIRACVLYRQKRYELAERELREQLAQTPDDGRTHAFLARCLTHQNRLGEALKEAEEGVRLAPALSYALYALGDVYLAYNRLEEAEAALREAVRLSPNNADNFEKLSWIQYQGRDIRGALESADRGLAIDPEHIGCLNNRSLCQQRQGDWQGAEATLRAALAIDPEHAYTHAHLGWALYSKAHAQAKNNVFSVACRSELGQALDHFEQSLRLSPDWDWPRTGLVEALRARATALFRGFILAFGLLFCVLLICLWIGSASGASGPTLWVPSPVLGVILVVVGVVVVAGSNGPPYVLAQWTRLGPAVLTSGQRQAAALTKLCLIAAAGAALIGVLTPPPTALAVFFIIVALVGPLAVTCESPPGWSRKFTGGYAAILASVGLACVPFLRSPDADIQRLAAIVLLFGVSLASGKAPDFARRMQQRFAAKAGYIDRQGRMQSRFSP